MSGEGKERPSHQQTLAAVSGRAKCGMIRERIGRYDGPSETSILGPASHGEGRSPESLCCATRQGWRQPAFCAGLGDNFTFGRLTLIMATRHLLCMQDLVQGTVRHVEGTKRADGGCIVRKGEVRRRPLCRFPITEQHRRTVLIRPELFCTPSLRRRPTDQMSRST